jgi:hypothetical protein
LPGPSNCHANWALWKFQFSDFLILLLLWKNKKKR